MGADETVRVRAIVRGRVQAVGFRAFVLDKAEDLDLRGTVTNRPDRTVECLVEGPRPAVEALLDDLRRGPSLARVDGVDVHEERADGTLPPMRVTA